MNNERFALCVGKGWQPLVAELMKKLNAAGVQVLQVKEKYGGLRVYYAPHESDIDVNALIDAAEEQAWETCESCGTRENVSTAGAGWIRTLCQECKGAEFW